MPPAAATEGERTGCTLERIATEAPVRAAASAARWPARPAPMIRTSWEGIQADLVARGATRTLYAPRPSKPRRCRAQIAWITDRNGRNTSRRDPSELHDPGD